CVQALEYPLTF
nr:immunoglobulin light chain junction region [Macaca mulatta]